MNKTQVYQVAKEELAYMIGWAPNYPAHISQTFEQAFQELLEHLGELSRIEKRAVPLAEISNCQESAMRAKRKYDSGDEDGGRLAIQYAHRYLAFASKGKPSPTPLF